MAQPSAPESLIAGRYAVDPARPLAGAGGLAAMACTDRGGGAQELMAVLARRAVPPRARAIAALMAAPVDGALMPLAHGPVLPPGSDAQVYGMVCPLPPGPALSADLRPWSERDLMECAVRPIGLALDRMARRGLTCRAIRLDNVFRPLRTEPVVLGVCWAAPPAWHQPAIFEPPYVAMCDPAGRGDGLIADDVYAAGVVLLALALGRPPMAGLDDAAVIGRKLDVGSFAALAGEERLSPAIAELLRGMLADDPAHRPSPALLADPAAARARRVPARPPRRAQHATHFAAVAAWDARTLAFGIATEPERGVDMLRSGAVDRWLRRQLADTGLAAQLEEAVRQRALDDAGDDQRADATLAMRAVALLDPLAPLCWRGVAFWPDGLGPLMAAMSERGPEAKAAVESLVNGDAIGLWATARAASCDAPMVRIDARQHRIVLSLRGPSGGLPRLLYALNPLLACASPVLAGRWVAQIDDLPAALEHAAGRPDCRTRAPIDAHIAAFVAARADQHASEPSAGDARNPAAAAIANLRLLAALQTRLAAGPLPGLAAWLLEQAEPSLAAWHNRARRQAMASRLAELARHGALAPMVAVLDDPAARALDEAGARQATADIASIDSGLRIVRASATHRAELAARLGQEIAVGAGMLALAASLALNLLG